MAQCIALMCSELVILFYLFHHPITHRTLCSQFSKVQITTLRCSQCNYDLKRRVNQSYSFLRKRSTRRSYLRKSYQGFMQKYTKLSDPRSCPPPHSPHDLNAIMTSLTWSCFFANIPFCQVRVIPL